MKALAAGSPRETVFLRADKLIPYGEVLLVMDRIRKAGVTRIALVTIPLTREPAPSDDPAKARPHRSRLPGGEDAPCALHDGVARRPQRGFGRRADRSGCPASGRSDRGHDGGCARRADRFGAGAERGSSAAPAVKPAPAPPPPPKEAHAVREVPAEKPKEKAPKPKKEPAPIEAPETPAPPTNPRPQTPPGGPAAGPPGPQAGQAGAGVTATVGGGDSTLGWYGAAVKAALEAAWIKPYLEDAQGTVSVVVTFDIARDGTTKNFRIHQSSGIPSLDRSAQRAVIEASPLPAVPETWTGDTIPVTMRFDLAPETH
jgi:TonB family protein